MTPILWTIAALVAGLLAIVIATRHSLRGRPKLELAPGERLPSTPLQRLAGRTIALGALFSAAAVALVIRFGANRWYVEDRLRLTVMAIMLVVIVVMSYFGIRVRHWSRSDDARFDERDRAIFDRASEVQRIALLVVMAVWTIGLNEGFATTKSVPTFYLYLMFWSCLIVDSMALPIGVLIGYRRN